MCAYEKKGTYFWKMHSFNIAVNHFAQGRSKNISQLDRSSIRPNYYRIFYFSHFSICRNLPNLRILQQTNSHLILVQIPGYSLHTIITLLIHIRIQFTYIKPNL